MRMRFISLMGVAILTGALAAEAAEPGAEAKAVFASYAKEFNSHNAKSIVQHWATDGVYMDTETGERTEGRESIQKDFENLFAARPGIKLDLNVERVRLVAKDVVVAEGRASATSESGPSTSSSFTAVLVQKSGKWLISNVQESSVPAAANASEGLKELDWLVGKWKDEGGAAGVETEVRWGMGGAFLLRSFQSADTKNPIASTQIIGWDPTSKSIRSWTFDAEGSFSEEAWEKTSDGWNVHIVRTMENGSTASGTQVLKKIDNKTFTARMVASDVNGAPLPGGLTVKVVRVGDAGASK